MEKKTKEVFAMSKTKNVVADLILLASGIGMSLLGMMKDTHIGGLVTAGGLCFTAAGAEFLSNDIKGDGNK